jgi:hypothetical protein
MTTSVERRAPGSVVAELLAVLDQATDPREVVETVRELAPATPMRYLLARDEWTW